MAEEAKRVPGPRPKNPPPANLEPHAAKQAYCGFGSCDNVKGHDGDHRCRCGVPVLEPSPGCAWHYVEPPFMEPQTLWLYLLQVREAFQIDGNPILIGGKPIVNATVVGSNLVLETFEDVLERESKERDLL